MGYNLLYTGEMGIGNTTSTAAIASAYLGLDPMLTVGRGSGINDERMRIKRQVVSDGLAKNQPRKGDAMDILCKVGGYDHAGLAGVMVGKISTLDLNDSQSRKDEARQKHINELFYYWYYYYQVRSLTLWDFAAHTNIDADFERIVRR